MLEDVRQAIDNGMLTILILFDFLKAFDFIPHTRLLAKLRALNMSDHSLRWFFSYLAARLQASIDEGGSVSDWLRASSDVPQGSVLGPLLFAIYINDLPSVLSFARIMIYADDTQVYLHFFPTNILQAIAHATTGAQAVANWVRENGLLLNHVKTKVMIVGSEIYTTRLDLATLPRVMIDGQSAPVRHGGSQPRCHHLPHARLEAAYQRNNAQSPQYSAHPPLSPSLPLEILKENSSREPSLPAF